MKDVALVRLIKSNLVDLFDVMVFGDEVFNSKPHPEIYLYTLKKLEVESSRVVVFEDSVNGVKSAVHAGIDKVFGVLHDHNDRQLLIKSGAVCAEKPPEIFSLLLQKLLHLSKDALY